MKLNCTTTVCTVSMISLSENDISGQTNSEQWKFEKDDRNQERKYSKNLNWEF